MTTSTNVAPCRYLLFGLLFFGNNSSFQGKNRKLIVLAAATSGRETPNHFQRPSNRNIEEIIDLAVQEPVLGNRDACVQFKSGKMMSSQEIIVSRISSTNDGSTDANTFCNVTLSKQNVYLSSPATTNQDHATNDKHVTFKSSASFERKLYIDVENMQEIPINNDMFKGKMLLLLRRANNETNFDGSSYDFEGDSKVRWEVQIQGRFKRLTGPLYFSIEIPKEEPIKVNWAFRMATNAICKVIRFFGYDGLHSTFGEKGDLPHFGINLFQGMDKFVPTSVFDNDNNNNNNSTDEEAPLTPAPPKLGEYVEESHDSIMRRRRLKVQHTIDPALLYTMSFNDTFFDPVRWEISGIPILNKIDLSKYVNHVRCIIYEVEEENHKRIPEKNGDATAVVKGVHTKRNTIMWFELRNLKIVNTR